MRIGLLLLAMTTAGCALHAQSISSGYANLPLLKTRAETPKGSHLPGKADTVLWQTKGELPLGVEGLLLARQRQKVTLLASAESPSLNGLIAFRHGAGQLVVHPDGTVVRRLPGSITFRVTASALMEAGDEPFVIDTAKSVEAFLCGLRFSAKVFRGGLDTQSFEPVSVRNVGMPLNVASEERVYRAEFEFGRLSASDHIVLFVNTPDGARLAKFFLQLD